MTTANQVIVKEVKIESTDMFQTIITIKGSYTPPEVIELRFETLFSKAKDPLTRQTKGQFFISSSDLIALRDEITEFIKQSQQPKNQILNHHIPRHELEASSLYERLISNLPIVNKTKAQKIVSQRNGTHVIFHVPHDSMVMPDEVLDQFLLDDSELAVELIRMTDHFTYDLVSGFSAIANVVRAPVSRLVIDVERFANDEHESMSAIGMGLIYRVTHDLRPLRRAITLDERQYLFEKWYLPHHERLTLAVDKALDENDEALVIDIHSYPSYPLPYEICQEALRPEICIGSDPEHTSSHLAESALNIFRDAGFTVGLNTPFSGALVPIKHYGKDKRVSAVMLEIRRDLYLDENTGKANGNYAEFKVKLENCLCRLMQNIEANVNLPIPIIQGAQQ